MWCTDENKCPFSCIAKRWPTDNSNYSIGEKNQLLLYQFSRYVFLGISKGIGRMTVKVIRIWISIKKKRLTEEGLMVNYVQFADFGEEDSIIAKNERILSKNLNNS